jgi:hypothetical protein
MAESKDLEIKSTGRGFERAKYPLCLGKDVAEHVLLKYSKTKKKLKKKSMLKHK